MSNEKKPREFWVAPHLCYEERPTMGSGYEHVIEYSAYEKLRARIIEVNGFLHDANKERGEWIAGSNLLEEMVRNQTKCTDELKAELAEVTEENEMLDRVNDKVVAKKNELKAHANALAAGIENALYMDGDEGFNWKVELRKVFAAWKEYSK